MKKRTFWVRSVTTKEGYHRVFEGVQPGKTRLGVEFSRPPVEVCIFAQQKRIFRGIRFESGRSHLPVRPCRRTILQPERVFRAKKAESAIFLRKVEGLVAQVRTLVAQVRTLVAQV